MRHGRKKRGKSPLRLLLNRAWEGFADASQMMDSFLGRGWIFLSDLFFRLFRKGTYRERRISAKIKRFEQAMRLREEQKSGRELMSHRDKIRVLVGTAEKIKAAGVSLNSGKGLGVQALRGRRVLRSPELPLGEALVIFAESRRTLLSESVREQLDLLRHAQQELQELNDALERGVLKLGEIDVADISDTDDLRLTTIARLKVVFDEVRRRSSLVEDAIGDFPILRQLTLTERETLQENLAILSQRLDEIL